jgi:16S rRNA (cytosine1402-N4)-methyltransferase
MNFPAQKGDLALALKALSTCSLPIKTDDETSSALIAEFLVSPHSQELIGRLQMASEYHHQPVLTERVVPLFSGVRSGVVVDATVGGGGHAAQLLERYAGLRVLGSDRDPAACDAARLALSRFGNRALVVHDTFDELETVLAAPEEFVGGEDVVAVLMDLGVSSPQLDEGQRGFSFRVNAPLEMRMDTSTGPTAAEILATLSETELTELLRRHGERRFARAIARSIRERQPQTTGELVAAVERAVPAAARRPGNVATRVFQALRVEVNDEEGQLARGLDAAYRVLGVGGLLVVISYHSGEDRAVKAVLRGHATGHCTCPVGLDCVCGARPTMLVERASAILASADEVSRNHRARSARLRFGWRVAK